jgi:hypothetical protein
MLCRSGPWVALGLMVVQLGACRGCDSKTPVPFKRAISGAAVSDAGALPTPKPTLTIETSTETSSYPDGTQKIRVSDTLIERPAGTIRASLVRDLDADGQSDVLLVTTDSNGQATLETVMRAATEPSARLALAPYASATSCRPVAATLGALGNELAVASIDFLCDTSSPLPATTQPAAPTPTPAPNAVPILPAEPTALDLAPPEPSAALAQTHHFVFDIAQRPHLLLHVAADADPDAAPPSVALSIAGADVDGDEHSDVQVAVELTTPSDPQPLTFTLTWLSRTSGLARDRQEPERSLTDLGKQAWRLRDTKPQESLALAAKALQLHHALCRETGRAKLWVDGARGLACGASNAAGKAAAARAVALAKSQALLPALDARAELDSAVYELDPKSREAVTHAIAAIRGDTGYRWQQGPAMNAPSAPSLRLPAVGFIDEDHVLLRGPIAQSYDLLTRVATPTGVPGSVLAADAGNRFVLTDIVRACDGYHLQVVPAAQVIGGVVAGASTSEPLLQAVGSGIDPSLCAATAFKKSDRGGFILLAMLPGGAVFARGSALSLVPLDPQGHATTGPRVLAATEPVPAAIAPGALDGSARHFAVATTEGVAVVDRLTPATSKLVRPPPSCIGSQVSDAALSPSGRRIAMLCAGHVYLAEPVADGGTLDRPTTEHP